MVYNSNELNFTTITAISFRRWEVLYHVIIPSLHSILLLSAMMPVVDGASLLC
jgi:hypothetical protein